MPIMRTLTLGSHLLPFLTRGRNVSPSAANLTWAVQTWHLGPFVPTTQGTLAALAAGAATSAMTKTMAGRRRRIRMLAPIGAERVNPVRTPRDLDGCRVQRWGIRAHVPRMG